MGGLGLFLFTLNYMVVPHCIPQTAAFNQCLFSFFLTLRDSEQCLLELLSMYL